MAQPCRVCAHCERDAIDRALAAGAPNRRVASQYGMSEASVRRHVKAHLRVEVREAQVARNAKRAESAADLSAELAERAMEAVRSAKSPRDVAACVHAAVKAVELRAKLTEPDEAEPLLAMPFVVQVETVESLLDRIAEREAEAEAA